jgi:photosystem II stability/assembly factor-like uncharacterized protein
LYALSGFPQNVFKTTDGGMNWAAVWGLQAASVVIDPRDSNTLYAVSPGISSGIKKSTDGGATWNEVGQASFAAAASRLRLGGFSFAGPLIRDPGVLSHHKKEPSVTN